MADIAPMLFDWDGESLVPRHPKIADKHYVVGESYRMAPYEDRSMRSHRFYFASINEAWKNLPEDLAERFATPDALRKFALIKAGYRDERSIAASSKAEALRVAAFVRPMDEYAVVTVSDALVTVFTAKSQSTRAMGKKAFGESKERVLDIVSAMIGTSKQALQQNADRAA
jgi:hypothetical protein